MSKGLEGFRVLTRQEMLDVAQKLRTGSLYKSVSAHTLRKHVRVEVAAELKEAFDAAVEMPPELIAEWLQLLANERHAIQLAHDALQLVWTGPEGTSSVSKDTWVAVTDLFISAKSSIDIASYALQGGKEFLKQLAERMAANGSLKVRMFLHIHRDYKDKTSSQDELLNKFAGDFCTEQWPAGVRRPEVYYDPRTLAKNPKERISLHAKSIVVDRARTLVTSANLTEAAQRRNIEAGVLIDNVNFSKALTQQYDSLIDYGHVKLVPGI